MIRDRIISMVGATPQSTANGAVDSSPPGGLSTARYRTIADHKSWETLLTLPGPGEVGASAVCERSEG